MTVSGNKFVTQIVARLSTQLPSSWRVRHKARPGGALDLVVSARKGERAKLLLLPRASLEPADVAAAVSVKVPKDAIGLLVASRYLGTRTRALLDEAGANYLDLTGNVCIRLERPALFIRTSGAERDPNPGADRKRRTLKGATAGRVVRFLCDVRPPYGVREVAERAETTPGYVSKLVATLGRDALIEKEGRGAITGVDWSGLIRRWVEDYSLFESNRSQTFLDPRGLPAFEKKLKAFDGRWALTGSSAGSRLAPVAPAHLATCFVDDVEAAATSLDLRPAEAGANIVLLEPYDDVVYERMWKKGGLWYSSPSQVAADLLTSPGRGPAEGEELIRWMKENEDDWRS